jgi:hypothetical protein
VKLRALSFRGGGINILVESAHHVGYGLSACNHCSRLCVHERLFNAGVKRGEGGRK